MLGQTVGSYRITGKIAEGGMGVVYRAEHGLLGKSAAVKVLLPELSANQEVVNRFFNEARAASTIRHPGIVEIFDFGYLATGMAYIIMEFLDGEPLSHRLANRGRLEERVALTLLRGMAGALSAAHAKGIVHRDLKPDNIYLVPDPDMPGGERPKILDFGIAKLSEGSGQASLKTRTGSVMGTPTYMSPEQCRGAGEVDARSDIYALGCMLYEMLTGRPPFVCEGLGELIASHMMIAPEPPTVHVAEISMATEALTLQLLAKEPRERVQTAADLARLLGQGSAPFLPSPVIATNAAPTSPRLPTGSANGPSSPPPAARQLTASPSTLSASIGESASDETPPRSRAGLFAVLAVFVVIGGVLAVVLTRSGGTKTTPPATARTGADTSATVPALPNPDAQVPEALSLDAGGIPPETAIDAGTAPLAIDAGLAPDARPPPPRVDRNRGRGRTTAPRRSGTVVPIEDDI